jgi:hypothetical protein
MYRYVYSIGRVTPNGVTLLGTAFMIDNSGLFCTCAHIVRNDENNLVLMINNDINGYQDTSNHAVNCFNIKVKDINPFADVCLLVVENKVTIGTPNISLIGTDNIKVSDKVELWGFPHSEYGRKVLTYQCAEVGAKILIDSNGIKTKNIVLNIQCRPGQSGSPVLSASGNIVAMILGSYAPKTNGGISLGGINPQTLHQTTHAVSMEYVKEML